MNAQSLPVDSARRPVVALVVGTRPEAIKMAPLARELRRRSAVLDLRVCLTAQHRELLDQVLAVFEMPVDHDLDLMRPGQGLADLVGRCLAGLRDCFEQDRPDLVLVQGDTGTTLAGALAGFYARIPVGHVEAGLRSGDRFSPYPEEMNRRLVTSLADLHFAPTSLNRENLLREGVSPQRIWVTGNTGIDSLLTVARSELLSSRPPVFPPGSNGVLITVHRRENQGEPLVRICNAIRELAGRRPDVQMLLPVHPHPVVAQAVTAALHGLPNVGLRPPLDYLSFVQALQECRLALTDSGGVQEEAPSLGKPVLLMRDTTERPEGIEAGSVLRVGTEAGDIVRETLRLLDDPGHYERMSRAGCPFGDGHASSRIVDQIELFFGLRRNEVPSAG